MRRTVGLLLLLLAVAWHAWAVGDQWTKSRRVRGGSDFASYYYATRVAWEGGNPYDKTALEAAAHQEETRRFVHPFFYPPPYLLTMAWTLPLELRTSYRAWFWLDELFALLCALVLWRWWRPLGDALPVVLAVAVATLTAIPNNHMMGQVNLPVLALVLAGLWQAERDREALGGALLGVACMMKMSPVLFVGWWLLRGRWKAAAAACVAGVLLTLAVLPLAGPAVQLHFYTQVLPGFGSGDYNGLLVPIDLFGNHSIPDLLNRAFPEQGPGLSWTARTLSAMTALALVAGMAWWFRKGPPDLQALGAQVSTVGLVMLLVPVYTYEHHLVWALPAVVVTAAAVVQGRVRWWWGIPLAAAWLLWAFELSTLKSAWKEVGDTAPLLAFALREGKFAALLVLLAGTAVLGGAGAVRYAAKREPTT
ncbi:MAG: DUF2029 domain-containing protein [Deltaproteobacteria bacterium]|nr:DUF2029 domain-containing protein [Deltaproteobacteria bacterium]